VSENIRRREELVFELCAAAPTNDGVRLALMDFVYEYPLSSAADAAAKVLARTGDHRAVPAILRSAESILKRGGILTQNTFRARIDCLEQLGWRPADDNQRTLKAIAHKAWGQLTQMGDACRRFSRFCLTFTS
jgi:hypothetical protein